MFNTAVIDQLARELDEPGWVTELRRGALARHRELPWPHPSDDVWRRIDVSLLDPLQGFAPAQPSRSQARSLTEAHLARITRPLGNERLFVRADGRWVSQGQASGMAVIEEFAQAARSRPELIRRAMEADGLSDAEQKLSSLNTAFHHDDLVVHVPPSVSGDRPFRFVHLFSASEQEAIFPMTLILVGAGSVVTLIDEYVSLEPPASSAPHLVNGRIELILEPDARVHYVRLQRWGAHAREFLLQRAMLAKGASLTMANINLGGLVSKAHIVTRLAGAEASTKLYGFVFGHGRQQVDQHTLQDHQAPRTTSDLQFRAALQDESRMVYTGLIRIARGADGTNAFQANHNLMLSRSAKAETIPMLEILADDVQCKHGASIGPIDDEQAFYLMSRGVPREAAQRLIVMGFIEPIVQHIPFEPLQQRLREELEGAVKGSEE